MALTFPEHPLMGESCPRGPDPSIPWGGSPGNTQLHPPGLKAVACREKNTGENPSVLGKEENRPEEPAASWHWAAGARTQLRHLA